MSVAAYLMSFSICKSSIDNIHMYFVKATCPLEVEIMFEFRYLQSLQHGMDTI